MNLLKYSIVILLTIVSCNSNANWEISNQDDIHVKYTDASLKAKNFDNTFMLIGCINSIVTKENQLRFYFYSDNTKLINQYVKATIKDDIGNYINKNMVINGNYIITIDEDNPNEIFDFMINKKIITTTITPEINHRSETKFTAIFELNNYNEIISSLKKSL